MGRVRRVARLGEAAGDGERHAVRHVLGLGFLRQGRLQRQPVERLHGRLAHERDDGRRHDDPRLHRERAGRNVRGDVRHEGGRRGRPRAVHHVEHEQQERQALRLGRHGRHDGRPRQARRRGRDRPGIHGVLLGASAERRAVVVLHHPQGSRPEPRLGAAERFRRKQFLVQGVPRLRLDRDRLAMHEPDGRERPRQGDVDEDRRGLDGRQGLQALRERHPCQGGDARERRRERRPDEARNRRLDGAASARPEPGQQPQERTGRLRRHGRGATRRRRGDGRPDRRGLRHGHEPLVPLRRRRRALRRRRAGAGDPDPRAQRGRDVHGDRRGVGQRRGAGDGEVRRRRGGVPALVLGDLAPEDLFGDDFRT